ncbi:MAG: hypothetical protein ACHQ5A_11175 [Opitutales bacterium]
MEKFFSANPEDKVTLQLGGLRITIEAAVSPAGGPAYSMRAEEAPPAAEPPPSDQARVVRPLAGYSVAAEARRQSPLPPIEMSARGPGVLAQSRPDLLVPAPGKLFLREDDVGTIIREVISQDEGVWTVVDTQGHPANITVQGAALCTLPLSPVAPLPGDLVFTQDGSFPVEQVVGEVEAADGGGWVIVDPSGVYIWVFRSSAGRWVKLSNAPM